MALAPIGVWARVLVLSRGRVRPVAFATLALSLLGSMISTVVTLPERLLLWPWLVRATRDGRVDHEPGIIVVLGYYRSGTTHLHNMLSCDPSNRTTRWIEALAPHGFVVSWWLLRMLLIPVSPRVRPQDPMDFGNSWPGEEHFGVLNWSLACALLGRFVLPDQRERFDRYHDLSGLTERELSRWRRFEARVVAKTALQARGRRVLLKSPSNSARVEELVRMFGLGRVKFIRVRRDPEDVIASNEKLDERFDAYSLQTPLPPAERSRLIREEFERTELLLDDARERLPEGSYAEMTFDELSSDPVSAIERAYDRLGLTMSAPCRERMRAYSESVAGYRPEHGSERSGAPADGSRKRVRAAALGASLLVCVLASGSWGLSSSVFGFTHGALGWVGALAIGYTAARFNHRQGHVVLGLWCALLTLVEFGVGMRAHDWWGRGISGINVDLPWLVWSVATAFRLGWAPEPLPPRRAQLRTG